MKKGPLGRSVEEVILMRKLNGGGGGGLPLIKTSASMTSLPPLTPASAAIPNTASAAPSPMGYAPPLTSSSSASRLSTGRGVKEVVYSEGDVRRMMEEVMNYAKTLQSRVQV